MRTIVKGETPPSLVEAEKKGWSWGMFTNNDQEGYIACRKQAYAEQKGVCAYTELPLDVERVKVHIDHYRRKHLYPKLAFKWDNLFSAVKDNRFGADYKDGIINSRNHDQMYASILSPLTENLHKYFRFSTSGEIEPKSELPKDCIKKAEETIRVFNLNQAELVSRRRTVIAQIVSYRGMPEEVIRNCFQGMGFPSVVDQEIAYMFAD